MLKTYQKILELCPSLIAVYSLKTGEYEFVSNESIHILGVEPKEFIEKGFPFVMSLVHEEDQERVIKENQETLEFIQKNIHMAKNYWRDFKYRMKRKDGEYIWVKTRGRAFEFDKLGNVEKVINFTKEITKEELFEEVNSKIEKPNDFNDLKNDYCHHLNNSLHIIKYLQNEMNPEYRHHLEKTFNRLKEIGNRLERL